MLPISNGTDMRYLFSWPLPLPKHLFDLNLSTQVTKHYQLATYMTCNWHTKHRAFCMCNLFGYALSSSELLSFIIQMAKVPRKKGLQYLDSEKIYIMYLQKYSYTLKLAAIYNTVIGI